MPPHFRAIAIDYDGTLTSGGRPIAQVLAALSDLRAAGCRLVLVTGRILDELRGEFPDCADHFDLMVVENGALVATGSLAMPLAAPVPVTIDVALRAASVPFRRGEVIVALSAAHEAAAHAVVQAQMPDCQLIRNRGELMLVPSGVSKASGLRHALQEFNISPHNAVAVGDAENDLAMLESCELAVAVPNAVAAVRERADLLLGDTNGAGVTGLLRAAAAGTLPIRGRRWQLTLGTSPAGDPVRLPAAAIDVIVSGGSGSGKSFATGLIAEQLVGLGYVVCILDPEGDHAPLGRLPDVVTLGGRDHAPAVEDVASVCEQSGTSVVVDLSLVSPQRRSAWMREAVVALEGRRSATGVPHWLIVDEAHTVFHARAPVLGGEERLRGHCFVTYRPAELATPVTRSADYVLLVAGRAGIDPASIDALAAVTGVSRAMLGPDIDHLGLGEALLVALRDPPAFRRLRFQPRWVTHVRHWHKYASAQLPPDRRFYFRSHAGPTGAVAANVEEFHRGLRSAGLAILRHHAAGGDFSRWVRGVFQDEILAAALARSEMRLCLATDDAEAEAARRELLLAIEQRFRSPAGP